MFRDRDTIPTQILFTQHLAFRISNVPHAIEDVDELREFHLPPFSLCIRLPRGSLLGTINAVNKGFLLFHMDGSV
jgi:hypothetical protein